MLDILSGLSGTVIFGLFVLATIIDRKGEKNAKN